MKELECWSIIDRETIKELTSRGWRVERIAARMIGKNSHAVLTVRATADEHRWVAAPNIALLWDRIQEIEAAGKLSGVARRIYSNF